MTKTQETVDAIATIVELYRRRTAWHKAEKTLSLQIQAICRRVMGSDKDEGRKLYDRLTKIAPQFLKDELGDIDELTAKYFMEILPLLKARETIAQYRKGVEKLLEDQVETLPIDRWLQDIPGVSSGSLAAIIGAAGGDLWKYATVQRLWKRLGLAVMPDGRQRHHRDAALAIEHGYDAQRRSIVWNIGTSIIRAQSAVCAYLRDENGEIVLDAKGKKVRGEEIERPAGFYRLVYDARKAYENERNEKGLYEHVALASLASKNFAKTTEAYKAYSQGKLPKAHINARCQRYMEKRMIRDLWQAWRKTMPRPATLAENEVVRYDHDHHGGQTHAFA